MCFLNLLNFHITIEDLFSIHYYPLNGMKKIILKVGFEEADEAGIYWPWMAFLVNQITNILFDFKIKKWMKNFLVYYLFEKYIGKLIDCMLKILNLQREYKICDFFIYV